MNYRPSAFEPPLPQKRSMVEAPADPLIPLGLSNCGNYLRGALGFWPGPLAPKQTTARADCRDGGGGPLFLGRRGQARPGRACQHATNTTHESRW